MSDLPAAPITPILQSAGWIAVSLLVMGAVLWPILRRYPAALDRLNARDMEDEMGARRIQPDPSAETTRTAA